jgi:hypothetical protein
MSSPQQRQERDASKPKKQKNTESMTVKPTTKTSKHFKHTHRRRVELGPESKITIYILSGMTCYPENH